MRNDIYYTACDLPPGDERLRIVVRGDEAFKSKGLGAVLGVASLVVIPAAAPALANSIGASSAIQGAASKFVSGATASRVGATVGSAITGAALGAITAKVAGHDVNDGAILGGAAGAIGGFWSSRVQTATPTGPTNPTGNPADAGLPPGSGGAIDPRVQESPSFFSRLKEGVSAVPSEIGKRLTDPDTLTDALVLGGSEVVGSLLGVGEMTEEQREAVERQRAELEAMRRTNIDLYNRRVAAAEQLLQQARQNDPAYLAALSGNAARIAGARRGSAQRRNAAFSGREYTAGDARRAGLAVSRSAGAAYDRGFTAGLQRQTGLTEAGLRGLPSGYDASSASHRAALIDSFGSMREQRNREEDAFARWRELFAGNERVPSQNQNQNQNQNQRT